jgi:hypothetical protein
MAAAIPASEPASFVRLCPDHRQVLIEGDRDELRSLRRGRPQPHLVRVREGGAHRGCGGSEEALALRAGGSTASSRSSQAGSRSGAGPGGRPAAGSSCWRCARPGDAFRGRGRQAPGKHLRAMSAQALLDFAAPVARLNPTAPQERAAGLKRSSIRALECLLKHYPSAAPRAALEAWAQTSRPQARLAELRPLLARLAARRYVPRVDRAGSEADPLPVTEDKASGRAWYGIREWSVPAAREVCARYWAATVDRRERAGQV